jgi:PAS domain S-box-containing protein
MNSIPFNTPEEEAKFYKNVLNSIQSLITVNQIEDFEDAPSNLVLWCNQKFYDFSGCTREEILARGFEFFTDTIHPEDLEVVGASLKKIAQGENVVFGGMLRIRPKNGDYHWFLGSVAVIEMKKGMPCRYVVSVLNMEDLQDTRNQVVQLIRENLQLKNQLRLRNLGKREVEIVKLIANGSTDKEISVKLSISPATVKTHRHNIIQKLHLKNKAAIAQFAAETGLV